MIQIEVVERLQHTRKFRVCLWDEIFDVRIDKHGKVWVADKKSKSADGLFSSFTLGEAKSEIYAEHWPFGLGFKSLWFKIENQTVYFERNHDQRAQRIESVVETVTYAGLGFLFTVFPILAIVLGLTGGLLSALGIGSDLSENILGVLGTIPFK